jgi:hypothetical protein
MSTDDLVGVGALGESVSTIKKREAKIPVTVLTNLAVALDLHKPPMF